MRRAKKARLVLTGKDIVMRCIVFDIGGTLMEYKNMPYVWIDFYESAFKYVREKLSLNVSDSELAQSVDILKSYNPKVNYRETDYSPEEIFSDALKHWKCGYSLDEVINTFYSSMKLTPFIYPESISILERLKKMEIKIAVLTDIATGMPEELHKSYFPELLPFFDLYVSSLSCRMRKPNPKGLEIIASEFNISPSDMAFVGDEKKDVQTAKRFGCVSITIDRKKLKPDFGQDYTINSLEELFPLLSL